MIDHGPGEPARRSDHRQSISMIVLSEWISILAT
jgi:hypothetical protein